MLNRSRNLCNIRVERCNQILNKNESLCLQGFKFANFKISPNKIEYPLYVTASDSETLVLKIWVVGDSPRSSL